MAYPDKSLDTLILEAARKAFIARPYKEVSLRDVCAMAGVTTGALYRRYRNKEELFDAIVSDTVALAEEYCNRTESISYVRLDDEDLRMIWECTAETQRSIINMIYDNYDGFRLLLCHAEGTKYENFLHDFVSDVSDRSYRFTEEAYRRGMTPFLIDREELHMLLTAYWSTMFEPVIHALPREKALEHSENVARLFNWTAVLGY